VFCERLEGTGCPEKMIRDNGTKDMEADLRCLSERDVCARNIHNPIIIAALSPGLGNGGIQDGLVEVKDARLHLRLKAQQPACSFHARRCAGNQECLHVYGWPTSNFGQVSQPLSYQQQQRIGMHNIVYAKLSISEMTRLSCNLACFPKDRSCWESAPQPHCLQRPPCQR